MKIEMQEVDSSNIAKIGYDGETQTVRVKFKSGIYWDYAPVPAEQYQALSEAESVGRFFSSTIRTNPNYTATRVVPDLEDTV